MLGRPAEVVGLSRMVLLPAGTAKLRFFGAQADHAPVPSNGTVNRVVPLTMTSAGRLVVAPLANRTVAVPAPEVVAFTVNCAKAPTALVALQNPAPENPGQLLSMVPVQTAGASSASKCGATAAAGVAMATPVTRTAPATSGFHRIMDP